MTEITFSGQSSAKGRSGYFALRSAALSEVNTTRPIHLELFSQRRKDAEAPISLQLTPDDAEKLAHLLCEPVGGLHAMARKRLVKQ